MIFTFTTLAFAFVAIQAPAPAPSPAAGAPASPAPEAAASPAAIAPAPEAKRLAFLEGDWVHQETYHAVPARPAGKGAGRSRAVWILEDHHLYVTYKANTTFGGWEARALLGYDGGRRQYRMAWFDNRGAATIYTGDFDAEGNLVLTGESMAGGQARKEQVTFRPTAGGGFRVEARIAGPDGAWVTAQESVVTAFQAAK